MAQKRMMKDIPEADVIITNPTHYSVAIKYDKDNMVSPKVVGKGSDHIALKIREIAKENNVPIVENVPLARNLFNAVKIGEEIPRNLYKAVAEILAFVYKIKQREKALA
jgi:flagellar biosynthetic protein FlhB